MAGIRLVSFDVWNTLLRFEAIAGFIVEGLSEATGKPLSAVRTAFERARAEAKRARLRGEGGNPLLESQEMLAVALDAPLDRVRRGIAIGLLRAIEHVEEIVYPEALQALETAARIAGKVAVLGNVLFWPGSYTRLLLEKARLEHFIDFQLYADEIGLYKPDRRAFLQLCKEADVDPGEAVHVGDELTEDVAGALSAGMMAVWVNRSLREPVYMPEARLAAIPSLTLLGEALQRLTH
ncbi:HAD family hydrolase [Hyperthermus butylicus]|uniref:Hydrolase (HAD superfamily) n=1 Tax=Hyperthermus butylicus (strain DSM 5456 / JCM 9403 / PLM1-5) TaxID=415426 RepID=A2BKE4_HYPBU|nr:HAD family hydrolase [Hyperthermus butylicus]ABM80455.1 putative hydrolase (HAD superfamily) [Hyperthermus butylicus DSM 5456]